VTPERWLRVEGVFREALGRPVGERGRFLEGACRDDSDLRREVISLLASHEQAGSFLDAPLLHPSALAGTIDSPVVHSFLPGQIIADRFRVVRFLAEGGMGEVYEALDTKLDEHVALKTVRQTILDDDEAEIRFVRECQLARKVIHPNVCRIHDVFEHVVHSGNHQARIRCLSMELLPGETLGQRLRREGKLGADRAVPIARQIALGLKAAHDAGVVHRDLKPENVILVSPVEAKGELRAVVTDFGLARDERGLEQVPESARLDLLWMLHGLQADANASKGTLARLARRARMQMAALGLVSKRDANLTEIGRILGTPAYMSPEQARGHRVDHCTDIWSFGVVFYEMLTGELPYRPESRLRQWLRHLTGRERRPKARGIPASLRPVIFRCLAIGRAGRYQSMDALLRHLSDEGAGSKRWRSRRGRAVLLLTLAAMAAALFGILL
jgi:serine/threonine protein kinase